LMGEIAEEFGDLLFRAIVEARADLVSQVPGTLRTAAITYIKSNLSL
jgi:hypothetical protein